MLPQATSSRLVTALINAHVLDRQSHYCSAGGTLIALPRGSITKKLSVFLLLPQGQSLGALVQHLNTPFRLDCEVGFYV